MCLDCYKTYGSPVVRTAKTRDAVQAVRDLEYRHCTGGYMHLVTDDFNVEDHVLDSCLEYIEADALGGEEPTMRRLSRDVYDLLRPMSVAERATVLAIVGGFIEEPKLGPA